MNKRNTVVGIAFGLALAAMPLAANATPATCTPSPAQDAVYEQVLVTPAVEYQPAQYGTRVVTEAIPYSPAVYGEAPLITPAVEASTIWYNFAPNEKGPFDGIPTFPTDPNGVWVGPHTEGGPSQDQTGVYQQGNGNGDWFYRENTPGQDAVYGEAPLITPEVLAQDAVTEEVLIKDEVPAKDAVYGQVLVTEAVDAVVCPEPEPTPPVKPTVTKTALVPNEEPVTLAETGGTDLSPFLFLGGGLVAAGLTITTIRVLSARKG